MLTLNPNSKNWRGKMITTPHELLLLGLWERYCKETGTNEWAINEGLIDPNTKIEWEIEDKTP